MAFSNYYFNNEAAKIAFVLSPLARLSPLCSNGTGAALACVLLRPLHLAIGDYTNTDMVDNDNGYWRWHPYHDTEELDLPL